MMVGFKVAARNVVRNRRRSTMTIGSIAIGTAAILLIGALLSYLLLSIETAAVRRGGHITLFASGYSDHGSVDPLRYTINDYPAVVRTLLADNELRKMARVITPYQSLFGLVSNPVTGSSKTFFGRGVIWSDRQKMSDWDPYRLNLGNSASKPMRDDDTNAAIIGQGLGKVMGLCGALGIKDCPAASTPPTKPLEDVSLENVPEEDFSAMVESDDQLSSSTAPTSDQRPALDLLASTRFGAPNVMRIYVERAERQAAKELDDGMVAVQLGLAQSLVYGREPPAVSGLVVQLRDTANLVQARSRLERIIAANRLSLELRSYVELTPFYTQTRSFFKVLFTFIALIVGLIVIFTIGNAMMMSVMERTSEIGTMRALGAQRTQVRNQFMIEGTLLGAAGAVAGLVMAILVATIVNGSGLTWQPPTAAAPMPFRLHLMGQGWLLLVVPILLIAIACLASWLPARRAGRMTVVEALRHV